MTYDNWKLANPPEDDVPEEIDPNEEYNGDE